MINRVVLVGRLTRDPELRRSAAGSSIAVFTVAVDNPGKDASGNKTASFIPCVVFNETRADTVIKYAKKGLLVGVEGRLNQRSFQRTDGSKGSVLEVVADSVQFLERREVEVENTEMDIPPFDDVSPARDDNKNLDSIDMTDDDLPF
jgi:single-strand DNA-binding protein